jgi:Zn-dependent protease with chaperone function
MRIHHRHHRQSACPGAPRAWHPHTPRVHESVVAQQRLAAVARVVECLCRGHGLPVPTLTSDDCWEINAGVTGTGADNAVLYFSGGALAKLTPGELAAVAAHEVAHIAAGDFDHRVGGAFVAAGRGLPVWRWLSNWLGLVRWTRLKRRREYAADRLAARMIGADLLISALRKTVRDTFPGRRPWLATHPHPGRRIRALQRLSRNEPRNPAALRTFPRGVRKWSGSLGGG